MKLKIVSVSLIMVILLMNVAAAFPGEPATETRPENIVIPQGTLIKVRAADTISSGHAKLNDKVHFNVTEDVVVNGILLVPARTDVEAVVTKVKRARVWDRGGELEVTFSAVKTKDAGSLPVSGLLHQRGNKPNFFVKYAVLGVLVKGKQAILKEGTEAALKVTADVAVSGPQSTPQ